MASRNWNPSEPTTLGLEWSGMRSLTFPLTQEVELGQTFQADATQTIDTVRFNLALPTIPTGARNTALVTVYRRDSESPEEGGNELEYGVVTSTFVQPNGGAVGGGASLVGGASVAACLVTPSDSNYVSFNNPVGTATVEFATAGLFTGKRILEVKVHYVAIGNQVNEIDNGFYPLLMRLWNGASVDAGFLPIDALNELPTNRVASLGEIYYGSGALPLCWPWTVADVQAFDTAALNVRFENWDADHGFILHSALLEVVWCEENREAVAGLLLGSSSADGEESAAAGQHVANFRTPAGADNWAKTLDAFYAMTICSARSSSLGTRQVRGAAPNLPAVDSFSVFNQHQGRVAPRLATNVLGTTGVDSRITPFGLLTTGASATTDTAPYDLAFGAPVYAGSGDHAQEIEQRSGGGAIEYPWIRFYARIIGDPADVTNIDIEHAAGAMNYTAVDLLLLPEIFDGWREVTLRWPAGQEPDLDNSGTDMLFWFSSTQGNVANRWEILGLSAERVVGGVSGASTYGQGDSQYQVSGSPRIYSDLVVTVHTDPPAVTGFSTDLISADFVYEETCLTRCVVPSFPLVRVNFNATAISDATFAYYEIQRKDTDDTTWRTIAKLINKASTSWADLEMRHGGLTSDYRMRVVRADGVEGAWTATSSEVVATPADTPCGTFYLSSNSGNAVLAYGQTFTDSPVEGFEFVEAGWVTMQHMYGRFGTESFHPTERGGVTFERTLLINQIAVTPDRLLEHAWDALRDLAWADIPYVCVSDELGNRWFGSLVVPTSSYRRGAGGIHLAAIRFTESTEEPFPDSGV